MISISYLFEGRVLEHLKKHKGKYAALGAAGALYHSDDITPDPIKNVIRRAVTGQDTIESSEQLLRGYENHPEYHKLKAFADQLDKRDLNRLTKFGIHQSDNLPIPDNSNIPKGYRIGGYYRYKPIFQNFRDRELRIRDDDPGLSVERAFKHELAHHIDTEKNAFSKTVGDINYPYHQQKREYVAHKFEQEYEPGESYRDFIKRARKEADTLDPMSRQQYIDNVIRNRVVKNNYSARSN